MVAPEGPVSAQRRAAFGRPGAFMPSVILRFYEELNDFLPPGRRKRAYQRPIVRSSTVKALIEAEGVPQTAVDLVLVNGESVGFEHRLKDGDRMAVYPVFEAFEIGSLQRLRPRPLRDPRFVLDRQLGTLARRLRLLGFDSAHDDHWDASRVLAVAAQEQRIVLTRDTGLLERGSVTRGYRLRASDPERQIREVLERFDLRRRSAPVTRCVAGNGRAILAVEAGSRPTLRTLPRPRPKGITRMSVRSSAVAFVLGGALGLLAGAGGMLVIYPFLFPPPVVSEPEPVVLEGALPAIAGRAAALMAATQGPARVSFAFDQNAPGRDRVHWANGTGAVLRTAQGWVVRLNEDFEAGPGPSYWIYLNARAVGEETDFEADAGRVKVAPLKSFRGSQNFLLPGEVDPAAFHTLTIWCESFGAYIGSAALGARGAG